MRSVWSWGALALAGTVATLSAAVVHAQSSTAGEDEPVLNRAVDAVGAVLGRFHVGASLSTLYDSNILRLGEGAVVQPGDSKSDFRFSPALDGGINLPVGRQQLFVTGAIGRDFYARNSRLDKNRYNVGGGVNWTLGARCGGLVDVDFSSRQNLLSELSVLTPNVQERLQYGFNARCQTASGLGAGIGVRREETRNQSADRAAFDVNSTLFSPEITYSRPNLGTLSLSGTINSADYPNRRIFTPADGLQTDGVNIYSGRIGYSRGLGTRLSVSGGLSYLSVDPHPRNVLLQPGPGEPLVLVSRQSSSNLGYDLSVYYNSGARLTASLAASRRNTASTNVGAQSQLIQEIAGDASYKLGRGIRIDGGASYTQRDYKGSFSTINEPLRRISDKIVRVFGSINYAPVDLYSVGLKVAHQNRDSNPSQYSYASTSVMLRLRLNYGR